MKISFSDLEYSNRRKMTKRDLFFNFMNDNLPWKQWIHIVQPFYYNNSTGRKPRDIEIMIRMYLIQYWFQLSDEATEEAIAPEVTEEVQAETPVEETTEEPAAEEPKTEESSESAE